MPNQRRTFQRRATSRVRDARRQLRIKADIAASMSPTTELAATFKPLSEAEIEKIHHAALDLLERVGMAGSTSRVAGIGIANGCTVNEHGRLLFPRSLVEDGLARAARRIAKGIEVTDEKLSISVVEDSVAGPGHFLGHSQTMALMETEYVYPRYADRASVQDWQDAGAKDLWDRAAQRARAILSSHHPDYIDGMTDARIRRHYPIHLAPRPAPEH